MGSDKLVKVAVGKDGGALNVYKEGVDTLERLIPIRWFAGAKVERAVLERVLQKASVGLQLDDAELEFASDVLSERAARYFRMQGILKRGAQILSELPATSSSRA